MPKMIIIDGNSLFFRAYYATAYGNQELMRNKDGIPTNALFAFSNMINKIISSLHEDDNIMVAFDTGKHTFRHEALKTYKANRKAQPEELIVQLPLARDFLKAMNIFQFEEEGYEGDDIAGSVANKAQKEGYDVYIYTSDRDFLQLIDKNIKINIIKKGLSDVEVVDEEKMKEIYGFKPKQIIDYKGLRGDSSDNLPGIPGIGEKTAIKLIQEYHDFDNIVEHAKNLKGKVYENILKNQELGKLCRDLAIIRVDLSLPFEIKDTKYEGYYYDKVYDFCKKYDLKTFLNKVNGKWKITNNDLKAIEYENVKTFEGINLGNDIGIALDYKDEIHYYTSEIYGIAISTLTRCFYINFEDAKTDNALLNLLKNPMIRKYSFDFKKIIVCLHKFGIQINNNYFDLLIASYLIDSSIKNDLSSVLNLYSISINETQEVSLFEQNAPLDAINKAFYSLKLKGKVEAELVKIGALDLFLNLEMPLITTLSDMEIEGFPLHKEVLDEFGEEFKKKLEIIKNEIYIYAGEEFNISSPKQLAHILYEKLSLPNQKKNSTSYEALKDIEKYHPIIERILEYRKYFKLITTYIDGLKQHIQRDGKIHATFNQAMTQTGRLSSSNPNLQNISIRDNEGKMIRKAFYYDDPNYEILSLDYSQIELRILAYLSNSETLKQIFLHNEDIHTETAKKIFHLTGEPNEEQRRKAKTVNFGIIYGISDWGLAEQLQISYKEAKTIIDNFYQSFPEIKTFFASLVEKALKDGYASTLLGRRRYLDELHDSNYQTREFAKRAAMNAPIQGSAADLIKVAMNRVDKLLKDNNFDSKMVLQIHDELILKVNINEKDKVYNLVEDIMENALKIDIPLKVEGGFGKDWYSVK